MSVESIATGLDTMLTYTACELWNWPLGALLDALRTGTVDRPSRGWLATCVAIRTAEPVVSEHSQVWPCNGGAYICARGNGLSEGLRRAYHTIERLLPEDEMRYSPSVGVSATSIRNRLKWWL